MTDGGRFAKALEIVAAFAAVWPIALLLASERFRKSWPCLAGQVALLFGAYVIGVVAVLVLFPGTWPFVLGLTAVALAYERWGARPARGGTGGLPPGSLAFASIPSPLDPGYYFGKVRKHGPVFKQRTLGAPGAFGSPTICVLGHDKGLELLRGHGDVIRTTDDRRWTPFADLIPRGFIRYMDDDDHAHYRNVFRSVLGPRVIEPNLSFLQSTARQCLARMAAESAAGRDTGTRPRDHMHHYTLAAFIGLFYGIWQEAPRLAELQELYGRFHLKKTRCAEFREKDSAFAPIAAVVGDGAHWYAHSHLEPSRAFRLRLTPRSAG